MSMDGRGIAKQKKGDGVGAEADSKAATAAVPNAAEIFARYGVP